MTSLGEMIDYMRMRREGHPPQEDSVLHEQIDALLVEQVEKMRALSLEQQQRMEREINLLISEVAQFDPLAVTRTQVADLRSLVTGYRVQREGLHDKGQQAETALSHEQNRKEGLLLELARLRSQMHQAPPNPFDQALREGGGRAAIWISQSMGNQR
jgi:hypothetical protein